MSHVSAFRMYEIYTAMTSHFSGNGYDAVRYRFRTRVSEKSFQNHKGIRLFERLAPNFQEEDEVIDYFASNLLSGKKWIGEFRKPVEPSFSTQRESLLYNFEQTLNKNHENGRSLKVIVEEMMNSQNFDDIGFVVLCDFATSGKVMEKLSKDYENHILFDEYIRIFLTRSPIYLYCLRLDEETRKQLLSIIAKQKEKHG